ncbi:MAG: hypothetical protein ACR5LF_16040 [Symbiopectobacterium sp.]
MIRCCFIYGLGGVAGADMAAEIDEPIRRVANVEVRCQFGE